MIIIIDANNLAGKLNLLKEKDFDEKLIRLMAKYKKKKYILVFDGRDSTGDKYQRENITVIYTPKDSYYKSADDKIIELAKENINNGEGAKVITDDLEIINKVIEIINESGGKIEMEKAAEFAKKINDYLENKKQEEDFTGEERDDINEELLKIWK